MCASVFLVDHKGKVFGVCMEFVTQTTGNGTRSALCCDSAFLDDHWSCSHRTFNDASYEARCSCEGLPNGRIFA